MLVFHNNLLLLQDHGSTMMSYNETTIVFVDNQPIGNAESFIDWCSREYEYKDLKLVNSRNLPSTFFFDHLAIEL